MPISTDLRKAIERDKRTWFALARDAKMSPIQLSRFIRGERRLTTSTLDELCEALGLELWPKRKRKAY